MSGIREGDNSQRGQLDTSNIINPLAAWFDPSSVLHPAQSHSDATIYWRPWKCPAIDSAVGRVITCIGWSSTCLRIALGGDRPSCLVIHGNADFAVNAWFTGHTLMGVGVVVPYFMSIVTSGGEFIVAMNGAELSARLEVGSR